MRQALCRAEFFPSSLLQSDWRTHCCSDPGLCAKEIVSEYNISIPAAFRCFDCVACAGMKLPEVLSIDEFKGDAGGCKDRPILTDPECKVVPDVLPYRFEGD